MRKFLRAVVVDHSSSSLAAAQKQSVADCRFVRGEHGDPGRDGRAGRGLEPS